MHSGCSLYRLYRRHLGELSLWQTRHPIHFCGDNGGHDNTVACKSCSMTIGSDTDGLAIIGSVGNDKLVSGLVTYSWGISLLANVLSGRLQPPYRYCRRAHPGQVVLVFEPRHSGGKPARKGSQGSPRMILV